MQGWMTKGRFGANSRHALHCLLLGAFAFCTCMTVVVFTHSVDVALETAPRLSEGDWALENLGNQTFTLLLDGKSRLSLVAGVFNANRVECSPFL